MSPTAIRAVELGLLRFAPPGELFPGRGDQPGTAVIADVRGALAAVPLRNLIVNELALALGVFGDYPDVVVGVAKAGIAWAALTAARAALPAAVVGIDGPRASGLRREVEGEVGGRKVLVIDNLMRSGASLEQAAAALSRAGAQVIGATTIVGEPVGRLALPVHIIWPLDHLVDAARRLGLTGGVDLTPISKGV